MSDAGRPDTPDNDEGSNSSALRTLRDSAIAAYLSLSDARDTRRHAVAALSKKSGKPVGDLMHAGLRDFSPTDDEEKALLGAWAQAEHDISVRDPDWSELFDQLAAAVAAGHDVSKAPPTDHALYSKAVGRLSLEVENAKDAYRHTVEWAKESTGMENMVGGALIQLRRIEHELAVLQGLQTHGGASSIATPPHRPHEPGEAELGEGARPMRRWIPARPAVQWSGQPYREGSSAPSTRPDVELPKATESNSSMPQVRRRRRGLAIFSAGYALVMLAAWLTWSSYRVSAVIEASIAIAGLVVAAGGVLYRSGFDFFVKKSDREFNSDVQEAVTEVLAILARDRAIPLDPARAMRSPYQRTVLNAAVDILLQRKEVEIDGEGRIVKQRRLLPPT